MGDMQQYRPEVGTNGHVDVLAAFVRPGVVVVHGQPDPSHHDHAVMAENVRRLREARDAQGRRLEIVTIDAPHDTVVDGVSIDHSYINFSYVNDGLVMSTFGDPEADAAAARDTAGAASRPTCWCGGCRAHLPQRRWRPLHHAAAAGRLLL